MGCLQQFASLVYAVNCVIANQSATEESAALLLDERSIRFRIGVKIDEVIIKGNDFFGDGVKIVAQLEGLAEPSCGKPHLMNIKRFGLSLILAETLQQLLGF